MPRRKNNNASARYREELMEREFEEQAKRKRFSLRSSDSRSEKKKSKPPLLLRVLTWCGVILLCFIAGYIGTSYMLELLEKPLFYKPEGAGENFRETSLSSDSPADLKLDMQKAVLSLFYPQDDVLMEGKAEVIANTREDNIREAVLKLLTFSRLFGEGVDVKHVFRNVDTVYLNFSSAFLSALNAAGAKSSTLFITGVVRTMRDNFPPITKVRFLVDSQIVDTGSPVDLTAVWQLPK
jgi:hypothetical protein